MSRERDKYDEAFGEACYLAWRSGHDPDRVDRDRIQDHFDDGAIDEFDAAEMEVRRIREGL